MKPRCPVASACVGGGSYLRSEQGETDRVQRGEVARGRARSAHAAHLDTKPHKHATHRARVYPRPRPSASA